jgi:hypothetical protein
MTDDISRMFLGASIEEAQDVGSWAQEVQEEYRRFLRVRGLQPLEVDTREAETFAKDIEKEIAQLENFLGETKQDPMQFIKALMPEPVDDFHKQMHEDMDKDLDEWFARQEEPDADP